MKNRPEVNLENERELFPEATVKDFLTVTERRLYCGMTLKNIVEYQ
jgi:hypothetical protein